MTDQISLMVLVVALGSGLVASVVISTFMQERQAVFYRYLLTSILLFNLLILSGLVLRYLQIPSNKDGFLAFPAVLPVLMILMATLKIAWLYAFMVLIRCMSSHSLVNAEPMISIRAGVLVLLAYSTLLVTGWFARTPQLLQFASVVLEIFVLGGAVLSSFSLARTASGLPNRQQLHVRLFASYYFSLFLIVLCLMATGWMGFGLPPFTHLLVNGLFLCLYNLFPLIWLRWYQALPDDSGNEQFERFDITRREREIIGLIREGKTNQEIADELYISVATVKDHNHNVFRKCGVRNRLELANLFKQSRTGEVHGDGA